MIQRIRIHTPLSNTEIKNSTISLNMAETTGKNVAKTYLVTFGDKNYFQNLKEFFRLL